MWNRKQTALVLVGVVFAGAVPVAVRAGRAIYAQQRKEKDADAMVQAMQKAVLADQQRIVADFSKLPMAEAVKKAMGENFDNFMVSNSNLQHSSLMMLKELADCRRTEGVDNLIQEYYLYADGFSHKAAASAATSRDAIERLNSRMGKLIAEQNANDSLSKLGFAPRSVRQTETEEAQTLIRIYELENDHMNVARRISAMYGDKLARLIVEKANA